jgi:hypothetical protein
MDEDVKTEEPLSEQHDFGKPDFEFKPEGRHTYRQEGGYLVCRTCTLHHAVWIGMERVMVGESADGTPILKPRSELKNWSKP